MVKNVIGDLRLHGPHRLVGILLVDQIRGVRRRLQRCRHRSRLIRNQSRGDGDFQIRKRQLTLKIEHRDHQVRTIDGCFERDQTLQSVNAGGFGSTLKVVILEMIPQPVDQR